MWTLYPKNRHPPILVYIIPKKFWNEGFFLTKGKEHVCCLINRLPCTLIGERRLVDHHFKVIYTHFKRTHLSHLFFLLPISTIHSSKSLKTFLSLLTRSSHFLFSLFLFSSFLLLLSIFLINPFSFLPD